MKRNNQRGALIPILLLSILSICISACDFNLHLSQISLSASRTPNATEILQSETPTPLASSTPTPAPLGSKENPILIGFQSDANNSQVTTAADLIATTLAGKTGYFYSVNFYSNYNDLYTAIQNHLIDMAWLPPFTYLLAHQNGWMDAALVTDHYGIYSYGSMFLANKQSGFTPYFDATNNKNLTDAKTALAQFKGKRPCWVEATSASGYIVPTGLLAQAAISYQSAVTVQTFDAVLRALYVQQICDFGATYAISGDPRTAASVQSSMPDILDQVIVIYRSDAVIPNLNLSYGTRLTKGYRGLITDVLINWVKTDDGKNALSAANQYAIEDLKQVDDSFYDPLRSLLSSSGVDSSTLIGR